MNLGDPQSFASAPALETPAQARVKILHSSITGGPSMHAEILEFYGDRVRVRLPRLAVVGSTVQIRSGHRVAVGVVRSCTPLETDCVIAVQIDSEC